MRISVDTNVVVRLLTADDEKQERLASAALDEAEAVVLTTPMLCELVWVLRRGYRKSAGETAVVVRRLTERENSVCDRAVVEAGLRTLDAGGDFVDGVISFEGRRAGAAAFVTFDQQAARILLDQGEPAQLLGG